MVGQMSQYSISFIGHLVESKRPDGFPKTVSFTVVIEVNGNDALKQALMFWSDYIRKISGMFVPIDNSKFVETNTFVPDQEIFIPMHMFAFIETKTRRLAANVPDQNAESKA